MTIRDGTKYEEVIGVRREWVYPWRFVDDSLESAYYDIAVMELGKRPVLLLRHIWFVTFQCYILDTYQQLIICLFLYIQKD